MAQQHHEIEEHSPEDVVVLRADGGVHHADEKDFKNMRLAIGTLDKTIFQISLSDDLTGTRQIDIHLKRGRQGQAKKTAKGDGAPPSGAMATAGRDVEEPPEELHATPPPQARLRITVAAEEEDQEDDAKNKKQDEKRAWFLTVATLFVSMAFDAMLHPPDWMKSEWYEKGWFRTRHGDHAAINPSHAAAAAVPPSPHPATASASQVFRAYFYLTCNSLTFAMALALVLKLLINRPASSGAIISMEIMVRGISLFLALTFALGTSNNWKVTGIACVCLLVYTIAALWYFIVQTRLLDGVFNRNSKINAKKPEKKTPQDSP